MKNGVSNVLANISVVLKLHYFKVKGLPQQSSGPLQATWVQFLVGEITSHMPCGVAKKPPQTLLS